MSEQDVPCPDPKEVVTRAILREELAKELANYPTKEDLKNELAKYPTKEDLKNELAKFPTREEVGYMIGAVVEASEQRIRADFAQFAKAIEESLFARIDARFDPFRDQGRQLADHETRIVRLEARPAKRRATSRRRRRRVPSKGSR